MSRGPRFKGIAVGGTFDPFHKGHRELLTNAFRAGEKVFVGVVSDKFSKRLGKTLEDNYEERILRIRKFVDENFPNSNFVIGKLEDYIGPVVVSDEVDAIVVTEETEVNVERANRLRRGRRLKPLSVLRIPYVMAQDGQRISSSRIRGNEIDSEGSVIRNRSRK
ncbi:MAG: pantetheine-phosphate adenylyltransferase [Nitrososphaerales archaeon]